MHSVCSSFNDLWMKSSRDEVRAAKNSLFASPSAAAIILKLHRKSNMQSCTCNQLERGSKNPLFFDKSPESGLAADDSCSNCIRRCFFLPSPDRRLSRCHTFELTRKKERLIAGYYQQTKAQWNLYFERDRKFLILLDVNGHSLLKQSFTPVSTELTYLCAKEV